MKKTFVLAVAFAAVLPAGAADELITLDLSKSTTELTFDADNGAWTGTYDDDATAIESQVFEFVHGSMSDYQSWWGFTASNSADNSRRTNYIKYQFSNMAKGGIALNEDGSVKKNENGAPVVSAEMPYIVAYYSPYMSARPVDITFKDGASYEAVGVYVNLNSYTYYSVEEGDNYSRAFSDGDKLTLTIHGVAADETEKSIELSVAKFDNGQLTITRGWMYVDLSELGTVNELYFTMKSTDEGEWGDNTPEYFCLDKLMVKPVGGTGVGNVAVRDASLRYDSENNTVFAENDAFVAVYDVEGRMLASGEGKLDVSGLSAGIYIARSGNASVKFAR